MRDGRWEVRGEGDNGRSNGDCMRSVSGEW